MPDRIILLPKGKVIFVELKAPGKSLRPLQIKRKEQLESLGFKVYIIDSYEKVDVFIQEVVGWSIFLMTIKNTLQNGF